MKIEQALNITKKHYDLLLLADPSKKIVDDYLKRGTCFCVEEKDPIAVMVLLPTRPETLEIMNIAVDEAHQGQGIAQKLLHFASEYAKEKNYKVLEIGTGSTGFQQLYLYQKCGFRMTSIDRDFFLHHYEEEIIENNMVLRDMVRLQMEL